MPARAAKKSRKSTNGKSKAGRKGGSALAQPVQPDEELGAVVGQKAMPRTQVVKKLWDYIKKEGLQDAKNRRMINADDKLKPVFGGKKQVSMFEMTKLVSKHLEAT